MGVLLSIDLGTESARAALSDPDGTVLATAASGYRTHYPRPGWAEQDPDDWWRATVTAVRQVLRAAGSPEVDAVGCATTASTVAVLDAAGRPLRPAILWMDGRASEESERTGRVEHPVLRYSGGADAVEWLVPKAMWIARHEPECYRQADRICEAVDYLTWRLTGVWVASRMNACCKWNVDPREGCLPTELYAELGVPELAEKLPQPVLPVGAAAGPVSAAARAELGLRGTATVAVGGIDAHLSLLATGALGEGRLSIVCGTSNAFITEVREPVFAPTIWGPYPDALQDGHWLIEGGQVSAGSVLNWVSQDMLRRPRGELGGLLAEAAEVTPVRHGLCVLDYFMGNRTPLRDPRLRGAVLGLTIGTTPAELYRAAVEGVAYGTRQVLDSFRELGIGVEEIFVSGGIQHNPLWLQITADVLGRPLRLVAGDNLTLRACSALGAVAAGHYPSLPSAVAAFTPADRLVEPGNAGVYDEGYDRYRRATEAAGAVLRELSDVAGRR